MRTCIAIVAALGLTACGGQSLPPAAPAPLPQIGAAPGRATTLFVSPLTVPGKILALPAASNGTVSPSRTITSKAQIANFGAGYFLTYDRSHNRLWVTSCVEVGLSGGPIVAFDADARGASKADVLIVGSKTGLSGCQTGVATDSKGNAYVADLANQPKYPGGQVAIFGADQQGNVAPMRRIAGANAAFYSPEGVALDSTGKIYVANTCQGFTSCTAGVNVYPANANGNVKPLRFIGGKNTTIASATGVAFDRSGNLYVADAANAIDVFPANAKGNVAPIRRIAGGKTKLRTPSGLALDAAGYIYVGNFDQSTSANNWPVLVFKPDANGNVAPVQTIHISANRFDQPSGVTVR